MSSARDRILNKLSTDVSTKANIKYNADIYTELSGDLVNDFKAELNLVDGEVFIVDSISDLNKTINQYLTDNNFDNIYSNQKIVTLNENYTIIKEFNKDIDVAITGCEYLSARTGSVVVSSAIDGRKINIFAPTHIVIAKQNQIVKDIDEAINNLKTKYNKLPSSISFITGPSRTADIEKTLILGAHGPKRLAVFIIKE